VIEKPERAASRPAKTDGVFWQTQPTLIEIHESPSARALAVALA
jgi:hypothetical protein